MNINWMVNSTPPKKKRGGEKENSQMCNHQSKVRQLRLSNQCELVVILLTGPRILVGLLGLQVCSEVTNYL